MGEMVCCRGTRDLVPNRGSRDKYSEPAAIMPRTRRNSRGSLAGSSAVALQHTRYKVSLHYDTNVLPRIDEEVEVLKLCLTVSNQGRKRYESYFVNKTRTVGISYHSSTDRNFV